MLLCVAEKFGNRGSRSPSWRATSSGSRPASRRSRPRAFAPRLSHGPLRPRCDRRAHRQCASQARPRDGLALERLWLGGGDLLKASVAELRAVFDVPVVSLLAALQAALPDLRSQKESALLVTNGGLGFFDPQVDAAAVQWGAEGLAIANSAKHKLVGLLAEKLKGDNVYVGEVVVLGFVKGSAADSGNATLHPSSIADKFWELYEKRGQVSTTIG